MKLTIFILMLALSKLVNAQIIDVPDGSSPPIKTYIVSTPQPKAVVLLYIGGDGLLNLQSDGSTTKENPLNRSVNLWKQYGIDAVLVDSPNDLGDARRGNIRGKPEYLNQVESVVKYYKNKVNVPVWIVGHSMGTVTALQYASKSDKAVHIADIIIAGTHIGESLSASFTKPVLAIHHQREECAATPISASESIIKKRGKETKSQLVMIDGGENVGRVCMGLAYHGFNKVEDQVVKAAADFILANQ